MDGESIDDGTMTGTGDTSEPECTANAECMDAGLPFCGPDQQCVTCEGMSDPNGACAGVNAERPLCAGGQCVECTAEDASQCTGTMPICDLETNACVPCTEHEQCGEAACNLYTGACLPGDAVVHVGGDKPDFMSLANAVMSFGEGAEGTIVVHGGKTTAFNESVTVDGGRLLAFLAAELGPGVDPPRWVRSSGNTPQLMVSADGTVLLDGLDLFGNASSMVPGVLLDGGRAWVDRSRIVDNLGGGIVAQAGAELTLRNCFVGSGNSGSNALTVDAAAADVVYTTFGSNFDGFEDVFAVGCVGRVAVTMRNSVLISFDNAAGEISCPTADVTHTASETAIPGTDNVALGDIQANWFIDVSAGDFHLDSPPVLLTNAAQWRDGDPASDIDGDPRPGRDGADDYAGADVP